VAELTAIRDQSRIDADRAAAEIERAGPTLTPEALTMFARQARKRMRDAKGGYRRDHLLALAQRVEVDEREVRIMGHKNALLQTLVAASGGKTAGIGVPSFVPKWRAQGDSNSIAIGLGGGLSLFRTPTLFSLARNCRIPLRTRASLHKEGVVRSV
jgi:site-specific DNA recombinase